MVWLALAGRAANQRRVLESDTENVGPAGWPPRGREVSGRKVRAPPDRVLGNAQAPRRDALRGRKVAQKHTAADCAPVAARVKSGGKSARPRAATHRRPNPTWSKAK